MKINVNGKEIEYFIFDSPSTIIDRYIEEIAQDKKIHNIPPFYAYDPSVSSLIDGSKVSLIDVRDILKNTKYSDLASVYDTKIKDKFPLTPNQVAVLWILVGNKGKIPSILDNLMLLNRYDLNSEGNVKNVIEREKEWNNQQYSALTERIKLLNNFRSIFKGKSIPSMPFEVDEVVVELNAVPQKNESLLDLFDDFEPSRTIPFISLNYRGKQYYKVYKFLVPPVHWRIENDMVNGLFLKILRVEDDYFDLSNNNQLTKIDNYYTSVSWNESNKIRYGFKIKGTIGQNEIKDIILDSLDTKIVITSTIQHSIKGNFKIPDKLLNKTVLLDMIMNDKVFSFFFYVDEINKSASRKDALYVKYLPKSSIDPDDAITLIFTNTEEAKEDYFLNVRISKAKSEKQVNQFQNMFGYLLSYYYEKEPSIVKFYSSLISNFRLSERKIKKEKKEKKTGKRADALRIFNENLFPKHYARAVAKKEQPYIIPANKVQSYIKKHGEEKIIEYPAESGIYYACEPREPNEDQRYIYPGLRENTAEYMPNKDTEPWLPACFTGDQKKKKGSGYSKYLRTLQGESIIEKRKDNILGPEKVLGADRYGTLPLQLSNIYSSLNIDPTKNILRYGVVNSPASILYCLERAFNDDYDIMSEEDKNKRVKGIRKELSEMNFAITKQETYDMTSDDIKNILSDENAYIDPSYFIRLCEELYKCNIVLFVRDDAHPQGDFAVLNHSQVELNVSPVIDRPTILIIKNQLALSPYPYQCEIIYNRTKKIEKNDISPRFVLSPFNEQDKRIITEIERMKYEANDVFNLLSDKLRIVPPLEASKLTDNSISQYIDDCGKCRALKYKISNKEICIIISPIPPLDKPIFTRIINSDYDTAKKFTTKYKLKIKSKIEEKGIFIYGEDENEVGYIPIDDTEKISIETINDGVYPPLVNKKKSLLDKMKENRKIAHILEQYTLYLYSISPENFGEKSFKVVEDNDYNLNEITKEFDLKNKRLIQGGKLIVPSKNTIQKLLFFVKQYSQNNPIGIKNYKDRKLVDGFYSSVEDFKEYENSIIFLSLNGLNKWANRGGQYVNELIISNILKPETDEPYIYRVNEIEKGKVMIIQNVINGNLERALTVSLFWLRARINLGYLSQIVDTSKISYRIYNSEGLLKAHRGEKINKNSLSVFDYGDGYYGAILFL